MKRILTIQDISCLGKCSLTVALPIISAIGVECCIIPTAVLSTHTAFKNFTFCDLTNEIEKISKHWNEENISFDGIYTGYLGSFEQLDIMKKFFDRFDKDKLILVDPCMADNGKLYTGFTKEFALAMANLCSKADVITPNITEACYLLSEDYIGEDYTKDDIDKLILRLSKLGCKKIILKGVSYDDKSCEVVSYDCRTKESISYKHELLPYKFHGTGDIFASACFASLIVGKSMQDSIKIAADLVVSSIKNTVIEENSNWYGVNFEKSFPELLKNF